MPLHLGKDLEKILESFLLAFGKQETARFIAVLQPILIGGNQIMSFYTGTS